MSGYGDLTVGERDRLADLRAAGLSLRAIARALGRAASTISRELRRNALESGAYRPHRADGAYMLRRQRKARLETDAKLAAYVTDRLTEGWSPEQVAIGAPLVRATMATGRLQRGDERGLPTISTETIYGWIYRADQKTERLWRFLTRRRALSPRISRRTAASFLFAENRVPWPASAPRRQRAGRASAGPSPPSRQVSRLVVHALPPFSSGK